MAKTVKCAWCGAVLPLTKKGRPKQHRAGNTTCGGSGQLATAHERIRAATLANRKEGKA